MRRRRACPSRCPALPAPRTHRARRGWAVSNPRPAFAPVPRLAVPAGQASHRSSMFAFMIPPDPFLDSSTNCSLDFDRDQGLIRVVAALLATLAPYSRRPAVDEREYSQQPWLRNPALRRSSAISAGRGEAGPPVTGARRVARIEADARQLAALRHQAPAPVHTKHARRTRRPSISWALQDAPRAGHGQGPHGRPWLQCRHPAAYSSRRWRRKPSNGVDQREGVEGSRRQRQHPRSTSSARPPGEEALDDGSRRTGPVP